MGIDIAAPADLVFRLARDVERWPELLPHYVAARRAEPPDTGGHLVVAFVARRSLLPILGLGLPVAWRASTWAEPAERRLRFVHRGGATGGMDVTWRITELDGGTGCRVEIEHVFAPGLPGWDWFIDHAFIRPIAGRTLATFRSIAEAVTSGPGPSGVDPSTNPSS